MKIFFSVFMLLISVTLTAQNFSLIKEINTTATDFGVTSTATIKQVGSTVFFVANDGVHGNELWKTDGSEAGTQLVKDINPGAGSATYANFTAGDGLLFFVANDGTNGFELWRSDGTAAGTFMLRDGFSECTFCLNRFIFHNGYLYFAGDDGNTGAELWKTDGTVAGTVMVKDIYPGPTMSHPAPTSTAQYTFVALGNDIYFSAVDPVYGRELFKTDGTAAGTMMVKDIAPNAGSGISTVNHKAIAFNGKVYFAASNVTNGFELWATDGSEAGTYMVIDLVAGSGNSSPNNLIVYNGALYFTASATNGGNPNLYKTDGTAAGTVLVRDFVADGIVLTIGNSAAINDFTVAANKLFFRINSGPVGTELYTSDGTTSGTGLVKDLYPGVNPGNVFGFAEFNNKLYFSATDWALPSRGSILFESDGTEAGTKPVFGNEMSEVPGNVGTVKVVAGNRLFFTARTTDAGLELWSTDGNTTGTAIVKDINTNKTGTPNSAASLSGAIVHNGVYYFAAANNTNGQELWKSDGTEAGTVMIKDIWPGKESSNPGGFMIHNGIVYFTASDGVTGTEIWKTDGTEAGTQLVADVFPGAFSSSPNRLHSIGNLIYFSAYTSTYGTELWRTDGTTVGTSLVTDLLPGPQSGITGILKTVTLNNDGYFISFVQSGNTLGIIPGNKLLKIDGTTNSISEFAPSLAVVNEIGIMNNSLYFIGRNASTNQMVLMKSENGALATQVKVLNNTGSSAFQLTEAGGKLYFTMQTTAEGAEPWVSDGTEAGTFLLKDLIPGNSVVLQAVPHQYIFSGGKVFFTAASSFTSNVADYELWVTDGTTDGTYQVKDIRTGTQGSRPGGTIAVPGNKILFSANDGVSGIELWESDGTADGTRMLQEFNTGGDGFALSTIFTTFPMIPIVQPIGEKFVFFARNADKGFQLYAGSLSAKYYVNDNSQTGDLFTTAVGSNANYGTAAAPFATLDYAISQARNGDTIYVDAGTYNLTSQLTINKSITILGSNYLVSPNDAAVKTIYNSIRNAETRITGAPIIIAADYIRLKGLRFSPVLSAISQIGNFSHAKIEKNYFDVIGTGNIINIQGSASNPIVAFDFAITDNRFERTDLVTGRSINLGLVKSVWIDNNVFIEVPASGNPYRGFALRTEPNQKVESTVFSNNYVKKLQVGVLPTMIQDWVINNNVFDSCTAGINHIPSNMVSTNVFIRSNTFTNMRVGRSILVRGGTNGGVDNYNIIDNTHNQEVDGINGIVGMMQLDFAPTSTNGTVNVTGNKLNLGGDYNNTIINTNCGIFIGGKHANTNISYNELNFSAVNFRYNGFNVLPNMPTGVYINTDNFGFGGPIPSNAVVTINNNKINGFKNSVGLYDPVVGITGNIGYGYLITGATVTVNNNHFSNDSMSVDNGTVGQDINANCNWYGSAAAQDIINKISLNSADVVPWLTNGTDNDAAIGFQPVPGACDGYPTLITLNSSTNVTCNGAANGTINITTSFGRAPFTYTWTKEEDANFISYDEDLTNLSPGTYHLAIVDGNGSNIYITDPEADGPGTIIITITEPDVLTATASGSNNVCFNGAIGSASVLAAGGTAPYTYLWSNGATTDEISNLTAGVYNVTVTDANGCTTTAYYEVTQPTLLTASINNSSTACSNIATVTANGGTPGYSYLWSNGSTSATISGVPAGTYSVTFTDANGCTATASINLTVAEAFNPSASVTNITCFGANNGVITVTNANGTAPFMFSKDGGVTFVPGTLPFSFTDLSSGTYNIAVKDVNGCTGFVTRTVTQPTALMPTISSVVTACFGQSTGAVTVTVTGGVPAYTYSWTKEGGGFSSSQLNISGLAAGNYTLTVTDKNGCTAVLPVTVPSNNEIVVNAAVSNVLCRNTATGSINLTVTGGTGAGFTYSWTGAVISSNEDLNNIGAANNYNVRITDIGSGCFVDRSYSITQPAALTLSSSGTNATGCNSLGTITATAGGGAGNYEYNLNGGAYQSSNVFTGLYAGTYTVGVKDGNGCIATVQRSITDNGSDQYESNNGRTQSKPISIGSTINARLAIADDAADWFVITTPAGGSSALYSLVVTHPTPGVSYTFNLYPASPNNAAALTPAGVIGTTRKDYTLSPGTSYRIGVTTTTLSFICYSLSVNPLLPVTSGNNPSSPIVRDLPSNPAVDVLSTKVYPNPHQGSFTLSIESPEEGAGIVEMYNAAGQMIGERKVNLMKGKGNLVQYYNMNQAVLFYRVRVGKHVVNGKIIGAQ
ncbi:MAG: T9SS type A sorting domain-containing protein [Chitinophagaceae bacterium]|nr:T9SS type A sorting domain-containing protein [Chitinophagaceae bacterium]